MSLARCFAFVAIGCSLAAPAGAAIIMQRSLSHSMSLAIAEGAIQACLAKGYGTSAVVVDRDGETMVEMRGDGASIHTMENARRKAYTAMTFKRPSAEFAKEYNDGNQVRRAQATLPNIIANGGGVPIKIGDDVIGGVGVSGSPGIDEECANAGIDKVKDELK